MKLKAPSAAGGTLALGLIAAVAAAAVFLGTLDADLLSFDDDVYITHNPLIKDRTWGSMPKLLTRRQLGVYNPLPLLVFSAEHALWGEHPLGYHAVNVVFHGANAALVFALVWALTRRRFLAFACALLWGIHPLRVESVAWASQLKEMLGAFFFLSALLLYLRRGRSRSAYWIAVGAAVCSSLCKPIYVTLPAVILLCDLCIERQFSRASVLRVVPFAVVSVAWIALSLVLVREASEHIFVRSLPQRIAAAGYLLTFYPLKLFWPARLTVTYATPMLSLGSAEFLLSAVALLAVLAACVLLIRRTALPLFAFLFYGVAISPMLGIILYPGAICADRYTYLASVGLVLLTVSALDFVIRRLGARPVFAYLLVVALALPLSVLTVARAEVWSDDVTLWQAQLRIRPDHIVARNNLGSAYKMRGQYNAALHHLHFAAERAPREAAPRVHIADVHFVRGEYREAARWYRLAAQYAAKDPAVWAALGNAELIAGDAAPAVEALEKAAGLSGEDVRIVALLGKALNAAGRTREAIAAYEKALKLEPGLFFAHAALGDIYAEQPGGAPTAAEHYRKCLDTAPADFHELPRVRRRLEELDWKNGEAVQ